MYYCCTSSDKKKSNNDFHTKFVFLSELWNNCRDFYLFCKKYMKESLPWVELGNQPIQGKKTPSNIITSTEQAVKDIIDMLEVAHDQSEIE